MTLQENLKDEAAEELVVVIFFTQHKGINIIDALKDIWFKYL